MGWDLGRGLCNMLLMSLLHSCSEVQDGISLRKDKNRRLTLVKTNIYGI